ncbi:hypothetical protein AB0J83_06515 [Actinoplanes sp. NPDC049596]|uniref:hypothetical protein n=1 Tax=unclassified Actinoplanes TaxID=2626549 RepID=UPI003413BCAC
MTVSALPFDGGGYERQLQQLGIPYEALLEVIGASNTERRLCALTSARTAFGYYAYNGAVIGLTGQLKDHGFRRINVNGVLPLWVNRERGVKLGVTSGNSMTGIRGTGIQPRSRYPKGELTQQMVQRNQPAGWMRLFDVSQEAESSDDESIADLDLWLLLMFIDKAKCEIRYEVSRPIGTNARGYITQWSPRVTPPPYAVEEFTEFPDDDDPNEGFGEIDVPVEPK